MAFYDGSEFRKLTDAQLKRGEFPEPLTTVALDFGLDKPVSGLTLRRGLVTTLRNFRDNRRVVDPTIPPMPSLPPEVPAPVETATPAASEPVTAEALTPVASTSIEATPPDQLAKLVFSRSLEIGKDGLLTVRLNEEDVLTLDSKSPEAMSALRIALGALLLTQENNPTN